MGGDRFLGKLVTVNFLRSVAVGTVEGHKVIFKRAWT